MHIWAFATSPYGLALAGEVFWCLSPREFDALRRQWQHHQDRQAAFHAGIQATLHNAHFTRDGGGRFTPAEFMPGYRQPIDRAQTIEDQKLALWTALQGAAAFYEASKPPS